MAGRRVAYRKRRQNKFSMFLIVVVLLLIVGAVSVRSIELRDRVETYAVREEQLDAQIASEEARTEELEEYRKYTQTKKYVEDVARDKLGLVYEDEIIFRQDD